jgi:hypothetical protein
MYIYILIYTYIGQRAHYNVEDMAIRVVVRKRPISRLELARGDRDVMDIRLGGKVLIHQPMTKVPKKLKIYV